MTSMPYKLVIGLEVHAQLSTSTKLFCGCSTEFGAPPNTQVCPVCLGLPGALPVMNQRAIELALRTGLAMNCQIDSVTKWDRKNYFYPDLPKGYQISQFDQPICGEGYLDFPDPEAPGEMLRVRLTRAHLEEDAGKSMHDEAGGKADSRIDLNRTGTPLLEIVSEPDMRSAQAAKAYLTELRLLLTYLGVSDCNMQEGSLRADANVNLHLEHEGRTVATPIVEVKNLNSFRAVERAIAYEAQRQFEAWKKTGQEMGQAPKQTRGWDDAAGVTVPQREKEESSDYRYFPDPDLVPLRITQQQLDTARGELGELPAVARRRLESSEGLKAYDADVIVSQGRGVLGYFDALIAAGASAKRVSSWIQQDVLRTLKEQNLEIEDFPITAERLAQLLVAIDAGDVDNSRGKDVFQYWLDTPSANLEQAKSALGIESVDRGEIESLCRELLEENPQVVAQVQDGNLKGLGSLIGAAKKKNPNADPKLVRQLCQAMIEAMG
ncbi:Asp-tRNA(Asn)/Glu-tRNA(Gln) amidotransferase subunit GatB [Aureliella helgolandensis]|uniref:Aspartyl/glutamyl-tRNA(Asn/Gln) amidotransferase subunit B n=1 Tax=Aureliella helgolandensis TaxID=2527968 RepID=A0A518GH51_9BACT|nr:Asp-tRNA(Asn)/Glu-tRNA(Gln) amidotransferase subunit GatB [Aureliella helgolandensis]QDV27921.1 Aspartyl/glutamyl-tRNA(Asn/Gln) amidotransferase subunit B [Aureliella helgolandensis]